MDRLGFIDYNTRFSREKSGKAGSYAQAILILDDVLKHQKDVDLNGRSIYDISDISVIDNLSSFVRAETRKMRKKQNSIFDFVNADQKSYARDYFCSSALTSYKKYLLYLQDIKAADEIMAHETNPRRLSQKLINHFDLSKEGDDVESVTKRRKGQEYFRRMVLKNYGNKCCVTGLNVPEILLASHIVEWAKDKANRMNPENGLCLSATYDAAFDKHLISFDEDYRMIVSKHIKDYYSNDVTREYFNKFEGKQITLPSLYLPSKILLERHREALVV